MTKKENEIPTDEVSRKLKFSGAERYVTTPLSVRAKLNYPPLWSNLRSWGNNSLLKTSYIWLFLVPILAKALSNINSLTIPWLKNPITLSLPFSWSLFYISAIFFSIAGGIYAITCPTIIRKYENFSLFKGNYETNEAIFRKLTVDYSQTLQSDFSDNLEHIRDELELISYMYSDGEKTDDDRKLIDVRFDEERKSLIVPEQHIHVSENKLNEFFWHIYDTADKTKMYHRQLCRLFYLLGATAILSLIHI